MIKVMEEGLIVDIITISEVDKDMVPFYSIEKDFSHNRNCY
jgi:hypothetical protein